MPQHAARSLVEHAMFGFLLVLRFEIQCCSAMYADWEQHFLDNLASARCCMHNHENSNNWYTLRHHVHVALSQGSMLPSLALAGQTLLLRKLHGTARVTYRCIAKCLTDGDWWQAADNSSLLMFVSKSRRHNSLGMPWTGINCITVYLQPTLNMCWYLIKINSDNLSTCF